MIIRAKDIIAAIVVLATSASLGSWRSQEKGRIVLETDSVRFLDGKNRTIKAIPYRNEAKALRSEADPEDPDHKTLVRRFDIPRILPQNHGLVVEHVTKYYEGRDFRTTIYDPRGEEVGELPKLVGELLIPPSGSCLVSVDEVMGRAYEGVVQFYDLTGAVLNQHQVEAGDVVYAFSRDSKYFVLGSGGEKKRFVVFDQRGRKQSSFQPDVGSSLDAVEVSPDNEFLVYTVTILDRPGVDAVWSSRVYIYAMNGNLLKKIILDDHVEGRPELIISFDPQGQTVEIRSSKSGLRVVPLGQ
jgi:WD40 repeat protein